MTSEHRAAALLAKEVISDLAAKVQFAVDFMHAQGLLEDGCFTFPDGDTWHAKRSDLPDA